MATQTAYSYLRVSGKGQVDGDGFPRQRQAIARYAKANGITIAAEYRDEGVSGTRDLENRPGLAALLDAISAHSVPVVLVERADRLSRDLMVGEIILQQFRDANVTVIAAEGGVDLTVADNDPTKRLIRQILGAVAEFDKAVLVLKLRAARERQRRTTGRCEGRKPYGERPGEAEAIARMVQLRRKPRNAPRLGYGHIAHQLTEEGFPTRSGKPWAAASVQTILHRIERKHPATKLGTFPPSEEQMRAGITDLYG